MTAFDRTMTFDHLARAVADWSASWLWPVTIGEAAREFGLSDRVIEAAVVHQAGIAVGDGETIIHAGKKRRAAC